MSLYQDIYKNYGDLEATYNALQTGEILPKEDAIYNYTKDQLMELGGAKQEAIDAHNELLASKPQSFIRGVMGGFRHNTLTGAAINAAIDSFKVNKLYIDPEFKIDTALESVKQEFNTEAELETLRQANNEDHFNLLVENLRDYKEYKLNLERLGTPLALASQLGAEFGNLGVNALPFLHISKARSLLKVKDVLKGATLQGVTNAAEEKLIDQVYNDRTVSDYVASFAMGAGLYGTILGGSKAWNTTKFEAGVRNKEEADAFAVHTIQEKATEQIDEAKLGPKPDRDYIDSSHLRDADGNINPTIKKAMEKKGYDPDTEFDVWVQNYESNGLIPRVQKVIQEKVGLAGFSQTLLGSENPAFRAIGRAFFEHGEGGSGVHKELTAALEAETETFRLFSDYNKSYLEHKALFATESEALGISMKEFDRMAYRYIDSEGSIGYDGKINIPGTKVRINEVLEDFRQVYTEHNKGLVKHLREAGVLEAGDFGESAHLFRRYDGEQFVKLTQELGGSKPIKDLIAESLRKGEGFEAYSKRVLDDAEAKYQAELESFNTRLRRAELQKETAESDIKRAKDFTKDMQAGARLDKAIKRIEEIKKTEPKRPEIKEINTKEVIAYTADAVYNRMHRRGYEHTADANLLNTNNQTLLLDALKDVEGSGLSAAAKKHVKAILDTAGRDTAGNPTKGRLSMDMNVSIMHNGREIKMTDLLDVDLGAGYLSAGRYWVGRAAMARKGDHFASEAAIEKSISRAAKLGTQMGMDPKDIKKQVSLIRNGVKLIKGQPIEDMSRWDHVLMRNFRKAVMNASLGKLGIVQASETGRMLGAIDAAQRIPAVKELMQGIATGRLDSAELKEVQDYLVGNIGNRRFMNHPDFRADDFGHKVHPLEKFQDKMSYYLSMASGWNRFMVAQNEVLMSGLTQKWYRDVMNGTFKETQMRDLGVDDLLLKDLKAEMTKHAKPIEGLDGNKSYKELGLENWEPATRRKFAMMLTRKSNNAIQMINIGETPMWLNTSMGKFLGQFRTFSVAALSKQTTRDYKMLREGDMEAAIAMQFNIATSVMANAVKIGFVAATLQGVQRDEYLERALNPVGFANQVASYVGVFSAPMDLGNMITDSVLGGGFAGGRYGITSAVPALNYINKAHKGISGISSSVLKGEKPSGADYRATVGIIPFSNNYAFDILNNALVLPGVFDED